MGHKNIISFEPFRLGETVETVEEHDNLLEDRWKSVVGRSDTVYVLGDVAFSKAGLERIREWPGRKVLIMGNHDTIKYPYHLIFNKVFGFIKYKNWWLSHAPVHSSQLEERAVANIHGHLHSKLLLDKRYVNVSVEHSYGYPVPVEMIHERFDSGVFNGFFNVAKILQQ